MSYNLKSHKFLLTAIFTIWSSTIFGQSGISLYHLSNNTYQGSNFNPAYMPEGNLFIGLPVLSGVMVDLNSRINYQDAVTINEEGNKEWDIDNFVGNAKKKNYISLEAEISTLYVSWRASSTKAYSVFIRERMAARGFYSDDLVNTAWHGNSSLVGDRLDLKTTAIDVRYYREYGFGVWRSIPNMGINIGVRVKFLNGMISAVTDNKLDGSVGFEEENYQMNIDAQNARINTSGLNLLDSDELTSHMISNGNLGAGIDLGVHWKINNELSAAVSVNDLGFIRWKVDPENYVVADTTFRFVGLTDLGNIDNFGDAYIDSLKNAIQDTTLFNAYTTGLNTSSYASLLYQLTPKDQITGTVAAYIVRGNFRMIYSAAYTRKFGRAFSLSANVSRIPQQSIDLGIAAAVNFGSCQIYMASDKLLRVWDVPKIDAADFRFGFNLVFNGKKSNKNDDTSDLKHPFPYTKKDKIQKDDDGAYWKIRKMKPRPIYEKTNFKDY